MGGCKELPHHGCAETHRAKVACFLLQDVAIQKRSGLKESLSYPRGLPGGRR